MKILRPFVLPLALSLLPSVPLLAQTKPAASPAASQQPAVASKTPQGHSSHPNEPDGNQVLIENCARCHETPPPFPAQISGTVVRHMRVRANLSEAEAKALLHFLNPN